MADGISKIKHIWTRVSLFKDWYKLIYPINRCVNKSQILHLRNGVSLMVGDIYSSDVSVLMEVFAENTYHLERISLPPHATVFDVGANIGAFSLAVWIVQPTARITALEPSKRNFSLLQKNIPFAEVRLQALAGQTGTVQIQAEGTHTALHLVSEGGIPVEALSLHDALESHSSIDLLKIDIEGAEYDVFMNAEKEDFTKLRHVLMEVHDPAKKVWFTNLFLKHGFTAEWLGPELLLAHRTQAV